MRVSRDYVDAVNGPIGDRAFVRGQPGVFAESTVQYRRMGEEDAFRPVCWRGRVGGSSFTRRIILVRTKEARIRSWYNVMDNTRSPTHGAMLSPASAALNNLVVYVWVFIFLSKRDGAPLET